MTIQYNIDTAFTKKILNLRKKNAVFINIPVTHT